MTYHIKISSNLFVNNSDDKIMPFKTDVKSIFFMSKLFDQSERNYWPIEFEIVAFV